MQRVPYEVKVALQCDFLVLCYGLLTLGATSVSLPVKVTLTDVDGGRCVKKEGCVCRRSEDQGQGGPTSYSTLVDV
jgi:hypothetical protein